MKMKTTTGFILGFLCLSTLSLLGNDTAEANALRKTFASVPAAALPSKAAELVKQAKVQDRQATTINVVKAALDLKTAAGPEIVSAISRSVPAMAAVAAGTAGEQQPKQAALVARAAAAANLPNALE